MKRFVTIYRKSVTPTKGKNKGITRDNWHFYETNSLTSYHQRIHDWADKAITYFSPREVVTDFVVGMPLDMPIVSGGFVCNLSKAQPHRQPLANRRQENESISESGR